MQLLDEETALTIRTNDSLSPIPQVLPSIAFAL